MDQVHYAATEVVRNGEVIFLDGAKGRKAGYYPPDSAHELVREAYEAGVRKD